MGSPAPWPSLQPSPVEQEGVRRAGEMQCSEAVQPLGDEGECAQG